MTVRNALLRYLYSAPRFRGRDRLIDAISKSFLRRPVRLPDGLVMDLDASEWGQLAFLTTGATEPETLRLFERLLSSGDIVFDIGAHVGHHSLVAARAVGSKGTVYAFDPQPYNVDRICRNITLNKLRNIVSVCAAAGERDGFLRLPFQDARDRSRLSLARNGPNDLAIYVEVPIRRLDTFMAENHVTAGKLIKIDVEGYELEVIRGLGNRVTDFTNIIFEALEDADISRTNVLIKELTASGFVLCDVAGNPWKLGKPLLEQNVWAILGNANMAPSAR